MISSAITPDYAEGESPMTEKAVTDEGSKGFEPPKYLASLITAVNDGAKAAQAGALLFALIGVYLLATAFSASDEDLLRGRTVTIAQIGANLPVSFSFAIAPFVFVFLHIYTLARYNMLAANVRQVLAELRTVPLETDRERCRQLLANVEFVHALAAPPGSRLYSPLWRWLVRGMIAVFPVFVLLLVQINALRYQSELITRVQQLWVLLDFSALVWFFHRAPLSGSAPPLPSGMAEVRYWAKLLWLPTVVIGLDLVYLNVVPADADVRLVRSNRPSRITWGYLTETALVQPIDAALCPLLNWGCRYLRVDHRTLVDHVWDKKAMTDLRRDDADQAKLAAIEGLVLRDRSFRFAALDESSLLGADLIGADLRNATLVSARLPGAKMRDAELQGADLTGAALQGAELRDAKLQGADLRGAVLQDANLHGAQLQGADLRDAQLQGADLSTADLLGAYLRMAQLQGADLNGVGLQGANLSAAGLQGADLTGAVLRVADLSETQLQGADLSETWLQGANLSKTQLQGANLSGARLWRAGFTPQTDLGLADLRRADFTEPLTDGEIRDLHARLDAVREVGSKSAAQARLDRLLTADQSAAQPHFRASKEQPVLVSDLKNPFLANIRADWLITSSTLAYSASLVELLVGKLASGDAIVASKIASRARKEIQYSDPSLPYAAVACRLLADAALDKVELEGQSKDDLSRALSDYKIECQPAKPAAPN